MLAFLQQQRPDDRGHASGLRGIGGRGDRIPARHGGFRRLGTRGAARLEALLERFQLALAALRGDGVRRRNAERDLEVEKQRLALGAALLQRRSRGFRRGGKARLQRLLAVHAERRQRLPRARNLGRKLIGHAAGGCRGFQPLDQRRARGKPLETPAVRLVLLLHGTPLGLAPIVPRFPLGVAPGVLLVLLRALLVAAREYGAGGRVEARPERLVVLASEVHAAGLLPCFL